MGNCMETFASRGEKEEAEKGAGGKEEGGIGKESGLKVKILLTRGELEWLVLQLKEKGERRFEDVLMEMGKERGTEGSSGKAQGWRPTLDSIMEIPELQSFDSTAP